jgi:hypothetical protein
MGIQNRTQYNLLIIAKTGDLVTMSSYFQKIGFI